MMVSINDIVLTALPLMNRRAEGSEEILIRRFRSQFGIDPSNVLVLCRLLEKHRQLIFDPKGSELHLKRLFWTLEFLKTYANEEAMSSKFGIDPKTYRKWIWINIKMIANLAHKVVSTKINISHDYFKLFVSLSIV